MDQYAHIRTSHRVYKKTIRQIARETGHSRNTIKKVLQGEHHGYSPRAVQPYPAIGSYLEIIDKWLENDKSQPKKQRHTAVRVYNRLRQEHGYEGSETTVRKYVRAAKLRIGLSPCAAFIPCDPMPGGEAEVDWGTCHALIQGERVKLKHFVRCYPCERQQALFDAHVQAFAFFGGVFPVLIYDNLGTAVQKIYRGKKRDLQEGYARFMSYYNFTPRFCNPRAGHEKGGVEGLVGYARRNYMVPMPEVNSLEELNDRLLEACITYGDHRQAGREESVNTFYDAEKSSLLPLPEVPFSNIDMCISKIDKYSTAIIDKNRYSVPTRYVHVKARALLYVDRVEIFYGQVRIASHKRLYNNNQWSLDPDHYLELIRQRPQAFDTARPIRKWRESWSDCLENLLERLRLKYGYTRGTRDFVSVLMLYKAYPTVEVEAAVELALTSGAESLATVEYALHAATRTSGKQAERAEGWPTLPPEDTTIYQQLGDTP